MSKVDEPSFRLAGRLQAILEIAILCLLLPFTLAFTYWKTRKTIKNIAESIDIKRENMMRRSGRPEDQLTVLVTGAKMSKALVVARCLWRQGHRVIMVETPKYWCSGVRFSKAVWKFEVIRDDDMTTYVQDMVSLIRKHRVNLFLPVQSVAAPPMDAEVKRIVESDLDLAGCKCPFFDTNLVAMLDDKHLFGTHCRENDLPVPETWRVENEREVLQLNRKLILSNQNNNKKFVLKNIGYDPIHRLDLFTLPKSDEKVLTNYLKKISSDGNAITPQEPWQVQRFVTGTEYSACCVVRNSNLLMLTVCKSSASQISYVECQDPKVIGPIQDFVSKLIDSLVSFNTSIDGIFCLDFFIDASKAPVTTYAIECNPRLHSQMVVYCQNSVTMDALGEALVSSGTSRVADNQAQSAMTLASKAGQQPVKMKSYYWLYNEVFKLLLPRAYGTGCLRQLLYLTFQDPTSFEADLDPEDPWPFVMRNHFQIPILLLGTVWSGTPWKKCDFNIGKVVEIGGD